MLHAAPFVLRVSVIIVYRRTTMNAEALRQADPLHRWWYALKPQSWPKLLVPALMGQALGVAATGSLSYSALLVGGAFSIADLVYVVLLNDFGDRQVDELKRRMFALGCSPKTIPDGLLSAPALLVAGIAAGGMALLIAVGGAIVLSRPWLGLMALGSLALFWAYTFAPLKLNYRGGGELLEMVGVGAALPWINGYLQSGLVFHPIFWLLPSFVALSLASALASGLADEESDRAGGKRTFTTTWGNQRVRRAVEGLVVLAGVTWGAVALSGVTGVPAWVVGAPLAFLMWHGRAMRISSKAAVTNAFRAQGRYKHHLHLAIWRSTTTLSALLVLTSGAL